MYTRSQRKYGGHDFGFLKGSWFQCDLTVNLPPSLFFKTTLCRYHLYKILESEQRKWDQKTKNSPAAIKHKQTIHPNKSSWHLQVKQGHLRRSQHRRGAGLSSAKNKTHRRLNYSLTVLSFFFFFLIPTSCVRIRLKGTFQKDTSQTGNDRANEFGTNTPLPEIITQVRNCVADGTATCAS